MNQTNLNHNKSKSKILPQTKLNHSLMNKLLNQHSFYTKSITRIQQPNGSPIQISQSQINFTDVEISQPYQIQINVKNVSSINRRVKIQKSKDDKFQINYKKDGILAPGLSLKISVVYEPKELIEVHSSFKIMSQSDFQQQILINVYPPLPTLVFEPVVNFGFIKVGKTKIQQIQIQNQGIVGTTIKLNSDIHDLQMVPKQLTIGPKQKIKIKLQITASNVGPINGVINILPKQRLLSDIEFTANAIQFSRFVMNKQGKQIQQLQIQPILVGDKTQVNLYLVNNTPKTSPFRINQKKGPESFMNSITTPQQVGRQDTQRILYFSPLQGQVSPYSEKTIVFNILGKKKANDQTLFLNYALSNSTDDNSEGLQNSWKYTVIFHFDDDQNQQIKLNVRGSCLIPKLKLSQSTVEFENTFVGTTLEKTFKIQNKSNLNVPIILPKSLNYSFKPNRMILQKNSTSVISVLFKPKKVGQHNQVYNVQVGVFTLPLKLFGKGKFQNNVHPVVPVQNSYQQSFQCISIIKHNQQSRFLNQSNIHLSSIISDNSKLVNKQDSILKFARKQRFQKKKQFQMSKIISECKTYQQNKPMDYEFQNKLNAKISQNHINLSTMKDPLYLDGKISKNIPKIKNNTLNNTTFDSNKQIIQYTSQPKNPNQQRIINQTLQPEQLRLIEVGPTSINIGTIFINCQTKAYFHVTNNNKQAVSIQLSNLNQELSKSSKNIQIIPGSCKGGFKIIFQALKIGEFKHSVQYILNSKHFFQFNVVGIVILPNLTLNKNELKFFFTQEDKQFFKSQKLILKNNFNYEAKYKWINTQQKVFQITPSQGIVQPQTQVIITVKYNINSSTKQFQSQTKVDQDKLRLRIVDGNQYYVKCSSQVTESSCVCKPSQLNFKDISVCKSTQQKFFIKNIGRSSTVFKIQYEPELQGIIQIAPQKKNLSMDETVQITAKFYSTKSGTINTNLTILLRGGKSINIPLKANIILPKVFIEQEEIDFGSTPKSGTPAEKIITLTNDSNIIVDLQLNLGNQDNFLYKCFSLQYLNHKDQNVVISPVKLKDPKILKPYLYQIKMNPKCSTKLKLYFIPQQLITYNFILPLNIAGYNQYLQQLQKQCKCKGIINKMMVQPKQLDFKRVIIQTQKSLSKTLQIQLHNPTQQQIQWWVGDQDLAPFDLSLKKGKIAPLNTSIIKVNFYPSQPGEFQKQINFFLDQPEMQLTHCYLTVNVKASSDYPCIIFDRPYIILPVVPINNQSRCTFQIFNDGYENLNLKHIIVQQLSNIDISLNYLNGSNLGITKKKIKVQGCFKSDKPLSFTLNIQFYDDNNRVYTIPISGTTDNSMFTVQQFYNNCKTQQQQIQQTINQSDYLKRYFNTHVLYQKPLTKFPESLLQNDMELFFQILGYYTTGFQKFKLNSSNKKGTKIQQIFLALDQIIRIIKSEGGLLNHIRPDILLSYQDFLSLQKLKQVSQNYYQIPWLDSQIIYNHLNKKFWTILLYQIMKIYDPYKMSATTSKSSKIGLQKNTQQNPSKYSYEEKQLLNWAQSIYNSESRLQTIKNLDDFSKLMDCEVLSALILKYTSNKIIQGFGRQCNTKKQIQKRCNKFMETIANIGIYTHVKSEDIERSNHRQMLVFLQQLYYILPNYLPKSQIIQFSCSLGQSVSKTIEISNPSKQTVSYWAKIQGSQDFIMESDPSFVIQSKKSYQFKIKYLSNFSNSSNATITFIGKKDSKTTPATMVFSLKGNTLGRVSQKSIQINNPLYQQLQFQISVTNNLQMDGDFKIQLFQQQKKQNKLNPFYCFTEKIKIKKGSSSNLNIIFAPMMMQTQKSFLYFFDPNAGQFQYELIGLVQMPLISGDILKMPNNIFVDTPITIELTIPYKNDLISKARKQLEILTQRKSHKVKGPSLYPKLSAQIYSVQLIPASDMINYPKQVQLSINEKQQNNSNLPNSVNYDKKEELKKIPINLNVKMTVKDGTMLMILKNASKTDIRRYKVILNVSNKPLKYVMQIKTNLFKQVIQPIPLINPTNQQNNYHIHLSQDPKQNYSIDCQKQVHVDYGKTQYVNLTFKPKSVGHFTANLKMENVTIGQMIEYELIGISQEPQATQITYKQNSKQIKQYEIKVSNQTNGIQRFNVKIDLLHATGPTVLNIPPYTTLPYTFTFNPKFIQIYKGNITFEQDGKYFVYKVQINTKQTPPVKQYKIVSKQRVKASIDLQVQEGQWHITTSDEKLTGSEFFQSTSSNNKYKLNYISGKKQQKKALIYFHNQTKGDVCYLIHINIIQAAEIKLNPFKVQLGKIHKEVIQLQNLYNTNIRIVGRSSNSNTFTFQPANILVEPKSKFKVNIIYNPSNLQTEHAQIIFQSQLHQKWKYIVSGFGILPTYQQQKIIQGELNKDTSAFINFRNPFKEKIQVNISLQKNIKNQDVFQLIMKNKRVEIQPLGLISIPIVYIPKYNQRYENTLLVYMNQRMSWKFSIVGVSTANCDSISKHYKFKCRQKKFETIQFHLSQLSQEIPEQYNQFNLKLKEVIPSSTKQMMERYFTITPIKNKLNGSSDRILKFGVQMMAFKPFEGICIFQIEQKNKCKWLSRIQINCIQPQFDDQINIISQINNLASVTFKLTNRFKTVTKFNAYFTPQSDIQLSITPKTGQLAAYGKQGTVFQINFHPIQYRKSRVGRLIIQTQQTYWSYLVKGILPHYNPPVGISTLSSMHMSTIDHK